MGRNTFQIQDDVTNTFIDFREVVPGSPKKYYGRENAKVTSQYYVNYDDVDAAIRCLLGYTERRVSNSAGGPGVAYLHRVVPHLHRHTVGNYAKSVSAENYTPLAGKDKVDVALAKDVKLVVDYERFPWDFFSDDQCANDSGITVETAVGEMGRWISFRAEDSMQVLTTRTGSWEWEGTGPPRRRVMSEVPRPMPRAMLYYTWHEVPSEAVDVDLILNSVGKTNSVDFFDSPARTLILEAPKWERTWGTLGGRALNVTLPMKNIPDGVNHLPDPDRNNEFHPVISADGSRRLWLEVDFYSLFKAR